MTTMLYELMHKDLKVAELEMDRSTGAILRIGSVARIDHMPVGTVRAGYVDSIVLRSWWSKRAIPMARQGIRYLLDALDVGSPTWILLDSHGLSLSDHYWVRQHGSELLWSEVNYFDNGFSEDVGKLHFGQGVPDDGVDLSSPDNTTEGNLRKRWTIIDGRRRLLKTGTAPYRQEPFNEVIASCISDVLGIPHVGYDVIDDCGQLCSACDDFIDRSTELVSAYKVMTGFPKPNDMSYFEHYIRCCVDHGIDITPDMDRMLVLDYLMVNTDRHTNNFGIVRDPDTLEWIGAAPVFDTGASLGFDKLTDEIQYAASDRCKPFRRSFDDQLGLVSDLSWVDLDAVSSCIEGVPDILSEHGAIPEDRRDAVLRLLESRISSLECIIRLG